MPLQKFHVVLFLVFSSILLSACGRDGSNPLPDAPVDTTAPSVVSSNISDGEGDEFVLEVDQDVRIVFSELMDIPSLQDNIRLYSGELDAEDEVEVFLRTYELTIDEVLGEGEDLITGDPVDVLATEIYLRDSSRRFSLDNFYTLQVLSGVRDRADDPESDQDESNSLDAEVIYSFRTQPGIWQDVADFIDLEDGGSIDDLVSASNESGFSLLVWRQVNPSNNHSKIWASRYEVADEDVFSQWRKPDLNDNSAGVAEIIDSVSNTSAYDPQVVMNTSGQAVVTWFQASSDTASNTSIWVRRFDGQWLAAENITEAHQGVTDLARDSKVSIDDDGNILVVWREQESGIFRIKSRYYSTELDVDGFPEGWSPVYTLLSSAAGDAQPPAFHALSNGFALMLWAQDTGGQRELYTSQFNPLSHEWETEFRLDSEEGGNVSNPTVKIDSNLDALAVWEERDGSVTSLWWARYAGGAWKPETVSLFETNDAVDFYRPALEVSSIDQYILHWLEGNSGSNQLQLQSYFPGTGWQDEIRVVDSGQIEDTTLLFDREGNANLVWQKESQNREISVKRFVRRSGWKSNETLELPRLDDSDPCAGNALDPNCRIEAYNPSLMALRADGRMMALWPTLYAGENEIAWTLFSDHPE